MTEREALAQPEQEPVVQWHLSKDGLPPVGSEVVGGYFYKDTWLKGEPEVFAWGQCRVIKDDHPDFPDGKRWITFGPSHNQITYWCWPPKKPGDTSPPQPEQSQVEETLRYEIDALEAKLAECRAQPEQEPVARYFEDYQGQPIEEIDEARFNQTPEECRFKLYTAPPQRKPLTADEISEISIDVYGYRIEKQDQFARAIEAAHGIKE